MHLYSNTAFQSYLGMISIYGKQSPLSRLQTISLPCSLGLHSLWIFFLYCMYCNFFILHPSRKEAFDGKYWIIIAIVVVILIKEWTVSIPICAWFYARLLILMTSKFKSLVFFYIHSTFFWNSCTRNACNMQQNPLHKPLFFLNSCKHLFSFED